MHGWNNNDKTSSRSHAVDCPAELVGPVDAISIGGEGCGKDLPGYFMGQRCYW